jgi:hypothetical protein
MHSLTGHVQVFGHIQIMLYQRSTHTFAYATRCILYCTHILIPKWVTMDPSVLSFILPRFLNALSVITHLVYRRYLYHSRCVHNVLNVYVYSSPTFSQNFATYMVQGGVTAVEVSTSWLHTLIKATKTTTLSTATILIMTRMTQLATSAKS